MLKTSTAVAVIASVAAVAFVAVLLTGLFGYRYYRNKKRALAPTAQGQCMLYT